MWQFWSELLCYNIIQNLKFSFTLLLPSIPQDVKLNILTGWGPDLLTFFFKYTKYNQERTWTYSLNDLNFDIERVLPTECCLYSKWRILWLLLAFRITIIWSQYWHLQVQSTRQHLQVKEYLCSSFPIWLLKKLHSSLFQRHFFAEYLLSALRTRKRVKHLQHIFVAI